MKQKSFTLIELLVVIAIIGFLASVVLVSTGGVRRQAKIAKVLEFHQSVQHILGAYAVGWWSFESIEPGNKVLDGSGYGNDGTVNGATLVVGLDKLGNALSFDGVNDYVDAGNDASLRPADALTLSAWIKNRGGTANYEIINYRKGAPPDYTLYQIYRRFVVVNVDNGTTDGGRAIVYYGPAAWPNEWMHIALVFSRADQRLRLYTNGVLYGSSSTGGDYPLHVNAPGLHKLFFGASRDGLRPADVLIDEVRIYERALSVAEIKKHYTEGLKTHSLVLE